MVGRLQSSRGSGWHDYCLNGVDFNHATSAVVVEGNRFRVKKQGYYRINAWLDQHGQGGHYRLSVQRNDSDIAYSHAHKWNEGGWTQMTLDLFWHFNFGDTIRIRAHADRERGTTYIWHSWNSSGSHSRVQVSYEAETSKDASHCGCRNCNLNWFGQRCEITPCQGKTRANHCNNRGTRSCAATTATATSAMAVTTARTARRRALRVGSRRSTPAAARRVATTTSTRLGRERVQHVPKGRRTHGGDANTRTTCSPCTGGYTCQGNSHQAPCPVGTGTPAGRSTCADCTAASTRTRLRRLPARTARRAVT